MSVTVRDVLDVFGLPDDPVRLGTCTVCGASRWREIGESWACAGCGSDVTGTLSVERQEVFDAASALRFPWLRLRPWLGMRPQGAVARGETGWRLFCATASAADLDAALRALARGEGIA